MSAGDGALLDIVAQAKADDAKAIERGARAPGLALADAVEELLAELDAPDREVFVDRVRRAIEEVRRG
jgi:hypothetical protein